MAAWEDDSVLNFLEANHTFLPLRLSGDSAIAIEYILNIEHMAIELKSKIERVQ